MKKNYVLDTNVLLSDPECLHVFEDNQVVVPMLVLEELDKHKSRMDEVGRNARAAARSLDEFRSQGSLQSGVPTRGGGTVRVMASKADTRALLPTELQNGSSLDNLIIGFMLEGQLESPILVSKDINLRVKCDSVGIPCQDYLNLRASDSLESIYTGVRSVAVPPDTIDQLYDRHGIPADAVEGQTWPNQVVVLRSAPGETQPAQSAIARLHPDGLLKPIKNYESIFGLRPRNKEQNFSFDLLMDPTVNLVTLTGKAGSGKTLLTLAAGLEQLESIGGAQRYSKLIVSRPVQPVGRDIGFLPGSLDEKMEPWISPIRDNLEFLLGPAALKKQPPANRRKKQDDATPAGFRDPYLELMQQRGLIEVEAITFIRGRSIPNAFIIIDEAQNLTVHELKTLITRVGEGTKIVLTGDVEQIDNVHLDSLSNGLTYAIERFKDQPLAGHVTLLKGERSPLATLASKIL